MMSIMRTTLTLDADVAEKLKELVHARRSSFKETVNDVLRRGLNGVSPQDVDSKFSVTPHESGFLPGIDPVKLN
jgi:hypothetical protein